jgi:pimeloyl-ACP methyl ester carboxylesterase
MPWISNQGVNIHFKVEGKGEPLLMLHGAFGSCENWFDFGYTKKLSDDYQLILIDLRGYGNSDKPHDPNSYSVNVFVQDIVAVLDALGVGSCHAAGISFGGWIVYRLWREHPERIQSLILLDGVPGPDDSRSMLDFLNNLEEHAAQLPTADKAHLLSHDKIALLALSRGIENDIPKIIDDINTLPEKINLDCLILTSDLDGVEMELMKKIASTVSNGSLITLAGLSHSELLVRSEKTIPHILHFLDVQAK